MICLTAVLTHGLAIPGLGYYYDDWYMLWSGASRGASSLVPLFSTDRPFMGIIYSGFYRLIGDNIAGWHLFALLFRILGACAFYWILNLAWPTQKKNMFVLAGMLFVVFPGFLAQPNAATKINHLIGYSAALFSIAFTLHAATAQQARQKALSTAMAVLLLALYILLYEYMVGLEVMRLAILFWVLWQGKRGTVLATAQRIARIYIPYLAAIFLFLIWRLFIFDSSRGPTNTGRLVRSYLAEPVFMVLRLIFQTLKDFLSASLFVWFVQAYQYLSKASYAQIAVALLLATVVGLLAAGYLYSMRKREDAETDTLAPRAMIIIGAIIILGAVFPVVLSGKMLDLMDPYKGYALHPSAGVIMLILGLLLMTRPNLRSALLVALLVLSVTTQVLNIQKWAEFWQVQKNFWWQVTWRAPDINNNTLVMAYTPDAFLLQQEYEIWGPLNLIYRPGPYAWPLIQSEILNRDTAVELFKRSFLEPHVRDIYSPKYYSNFLLFSQPSATSCARAIDGRMPVYSASERGIVEKVGRYSNLGLIQAKASSHVPPPTIFGREPEHGWCYYFQKAELARQVGDWQSIGSIYDAASSAGLAAGDPTEYLVFIEGLVNSGRETEAAALAQERIELKSAAHFSICNSLSSAPVYPEAFGYRGRQIFALVCEDIDN
jgi:hypothetical protein